MDNNSGDEVEPFPSFPLPENDEIPSRGRRPRRTEVPRRSRRRTDGGISRTAVEMNIPLNRLHRRQSRDKPEELDDEVGSQLREEEAGLLSTSIDSTREKLTRLEEQESSHGWFQSLDKRLVGLVLALLLLTLYFASNELSAVFLNQSPYDLDLDSAILDGPLGILLHPEEHIYRRPRQLTEYWNITSGYRAPDGVLKKIYLINGQFPGPLIECRTGDRLTIHVTNQLENAQDKISIHWHGLNMRGANAMDGASGFTQCAIPPNRTFTYDFEIQSDSVGTFWYHAHSDVQRGDGMYGGLVVHDAKDRSRDLARYRYEKEVLLLIGDWYHRSAHDVLDWYMSIRGFRNEPVPDSLLINGVGKFICSRAVPARPVVCRDKWKAKTPGLFHDDLRGIPTRLRIVNVGQLAGFTLGVPSGTLTPLTVDGGQPIIGVPADSVGILHPGERVDILLQWDEAVKPDDWSMRVSFDQENFKYPNPALQPHQSFPFLTGKTVDTENLMLGWEMGLLTPIEPFALDLATASLTTPNNYDKIPSTADQTILLYAKTEQRSQFGNHPMGFINRTSWAPQAIPQLPLNSLIRDSWDSHQLVPFIPIPKSKPVWVDIILNNLDDDSHPFHLHGYNFYVLSSHRADHGWGSYSPHATAGDAAIKPDLNLVDPLKKDTFNVPRRGYAVLRFRADNPGIWMFHCHVLFHMASGMAMGLQIGGDEGHTKINSEALDYCKSL